jgi:hypothetical protein
MTVRKVNTREWLLISYRPEVRKTNASCANNCATIVTDQLVVRSKETMEGSEEDEQWRNELVVVGTAVIIAGSLLQRISTPEYPGPFSRNLTARSHRQYVLLDIPVLMNRT